MVDLAMSRGGDTPWSCRGDGKTGSSWLARCCKRLAPRRLRPLPDGGGRTFAGRDQRHFPESGLSL